MKAAFDAKEATSGLKRLRTEAPNQDAPACAYVKQIDTQAAAVTPNELQEASKQDALDYNSKEVNVLEKEMQVHFTLRGVYRLKRVSLTLRGVFP